ncbi:MAG: flagellar basal body L-ring protein FlgH [Myxococcota bacterium]|nr:flagellar basal body L-ring protein FlgH [Myxococcota bacterium]
MTRVLPLLMLVAAVTHSFKAVAMDGSRPIPPAVSASPPPAPVSFPGSLWTEVGARSLVGMNGNARRVGDLITIYIDEKTITELSAETGTQRKSGMQGKLGSFFGLGKQITSNNQGNVGGGLGYETESKHDFDGQGKTARAGTLQGRLTCRVIEVMPNGNLRVWGYKQVRSNRETQFLVVEGLARPLDIQADNTIQSSLLAEAKIEFKGAGVLGDKQGPGVVQRGMDHAWPF